MSLSGYRPVHRIGYLERAKKVVGYLVKMKHTVIIFRTRLSDYSNITHIKNDWEYYIYGNVKEELPKDAPKSLGKPNILTHYVDANLYHDILIGRAVTGTLYFIN